MGKEFCSWKKFEEGVEVLLSKIEIPDYIIAIPRGGLVLGVRLSHELDKPLAVYGTDSMKEYDSKSSGLLVDDISDTGNAFLTALMTNQLYSRKISTASLYVKPKTLYLPQYYAFETSEWIIFPWERKTEDSVKASWKFS